MRMVAMLNLGLRFLLELCLLAALAYWGFQLEGSWLLRVGLALVAPLLAALIWGTFVAPKARRLLDDPWRFLLEIALFALGASALLAAQRPVLAAALFVIFLFNRLLLTALGALGQDGGPLPT